MKILITFTLLFGIMTGSSYCFDETEWYLFQNFGIPLGPHYGNYDNSYEEHKGMNNDETMENVNNEAKYIDDVADDDDDGIDEIDGTTSYADAANSSDNISNEEGNNNTEEEEEEQQQEHSKKLQKKPYKKAKDLTMLKKKYKKINPEPKIKNSFHYVAPEDVEFQLQRYKRATDNHDYNEAYREFIKKNFGDDSVRPYQGDENEDESDEGSNENAESDEHEDAEGYNEEVDNNDEDSSSNESGEIDNDYLHVKQESDKSAAESKHCKLVHKDGQQCSICKNPKTNDQSESCSYSSSPPPKRYAFKKKTNHGYKTDKDDIDGEENPKEFVSRHHKKSQPKKYENSDEKYYQKKPKSKKSKKSKKEDKSAEGSHISPNYYGYYDRQTDTPVKPHGSYDQDLIYHASEPFAAKFNSDKSNVDEVLNSFKSRDWSNCKQKKFDGFTCYYCKQPNGATEEECMFLQDEGNNSGKDPQTSQTKIIPQTLAKPKTERRQLNRNKNYKLIPIISKNLDPVKNTNRRMDITKPEKYIDGGAPMKTVEYREPALGTRTLKRMISVKLEEEKDSPSKSILYSKIMNG